MHQKKIMHRDLKPENILLNSSAEGVFDIRVADFGLSAFLEDGQVLKQRCGTPGYVAPEVFTQKGYNLKVDMFSVGSIMFNLLTGHLLFNATSFKRLLRKNIACDLDHLEAET